MHNDKKQLKKKLKESRMNLKNRNDHKNFKKGGANIDYKI